MKKLVLFLMMLGFFGFVNTQQVFSQDNNGIILDLNDDTVSADLMDPQFFYAEEDASASNGGSTTTIALIIGAVVVVGGVAFFLLRKKK